MSSPWSETQMCTSPSGLPAPLRVHVRPAWEPEAHGGLSEAHSVGKSCRERVWKACARRQAVKKQQAGGWWVESGEGWRGSGRGPGPVRVAGEAAGTFGSGPGSPDGWGSCGGGGGGGVGV